MVFFRSEKNYICVIQDAGMTALTGSAEVRDGGNIEIKRSKVSPNLPCFNPRVVFTLLLRSQRLWL